MAKVLLIDKQSHMLDLLRSKFELEGFEVLSSVSGDEGVELAENEQPDLIVLDERLQDDSGVAVTERLKESEAAAEIPVILLTPRASEGGGAGKDGASSSVQMPFRPSQLMALVRENL
ncbi:MAG: response regulator [Trueperaceae bacterium]